MMTLGTLSQSRQTSIRDLIWIHRFFRKRQKEPLGFVRIGGFVIVNNKKQEQI